MCAHLIDMPTKIPNARLEIPQLLCILLSCSAFAIFKASAYFAEEKVDSHKTPPLKILGCKFRALFQSYSELGTRMDIVDSAQNAFQIASHFVCIREDVLGTVIRIEYRDLVIQRSHKRVSSQFVHRQKPPEILDLSLEILYLTVENMCRLASPFPPLFMHTMQLFQHLRNGELPPMCLHVFGNP